MRRFFRGLILAFGVAVFYLAAVSFAEEAALPVIGEDPSGSEHGFVISNETGKDIKGVAVRVNYGEYGDNLLAEDDMIEDGSKVQFYCERGEMVNYVPAVYDIKLTFADDTEAVLHTVPLGDAKEISVLQSAGEGEAAENAENAESAENADTAAEMITYIRFTSLSLNYETDTLRRETEIAQIGEQVLEADYNAKVASAGSSWSGGGDGGGGGGDNGGGGDSCLNDGLLF